MFIENNLKKFKEAPESLRNMMGLFGLTVIIIFTFFILNIYFGPSDKILNVSKTVDTNKLSEAEQKIISSLPRGKLIFYESDKGYKLSPNEYETVCKNTKIVTQRAVMGANITDSKANQLYIDNGNKIDEYSVKWESSVNKCFAGYTVRALEGTTDTVTVEGEAKGFFKTSIDTRVYFIKNF
tara:strand:+ start:624 stop:1169 length:546 start_codon:yes stop_codon:yes gene_type:complete